MASLPDRALCDLRLRYATLEILYDIPGGIIPTPQQTPARPPRLDELLDGETDHEDLPAAGFPDDSVEDPDLQLCPNLLLTGRAVIAAMIQQW